MVMGEETPRAPRNGESVKIAMISAGRPSILISPKLVKCVGWSPMLDGQGRLILHLEQLALDNGIEPVPVTEGRDDVVDDSDGHLAKF